MTVFLYSVYDEVAKQSMPVFQANNDNVAMRIFDQGMVKMVKDSGIDSRGDYKLYRIAKMDTDTSIVIGEEKAFRVVDHGDIENGSE